MKNPLSHLLKSVSSGFNEASVPLDLPAPWFLPIEDSPDGSASGMGPSGPSLEYDAEFSVLSARLSPKTDVQYGSFTASAPEPDWKEIERDCRRLLLRSKDLNLLVWFTRSRTRQAGAVGLLQGLSALQQVCDSFGDSVHPQLDIEGVRDPIVRANTLAALCDPEGLVQDVRDVVIVPGTAHRLTVRDVERALSVPRAPYAPEPQVMHRQLAELQEKGNRELLALQACANCVSRLQDWAQSSMQEDAPSFEPLMKLLRPLQAAGQDQKNQEVPHLLAEAVEDTAQPERPRVSENHPPSLGRMTAQPWPALMAQGIQPSPSVEQTREQLRQALVQIREWIEQHEPSSPVTVLLKQAERMWGKRFSEVADMIPPDLLKAWDRAD